MTKKRVHEIAKEQGMSSADVLTKLRAAGFDVTAAASTVDEAEALRALGGNGAAPAKPAAAARVPRSRPPRRRAAPPQRAPAGPAGAPRAPAARRPGRLPPRRRSARAGSSSPTARP